MSNLNYNTTLQSNNSDLQAILNTINELPDAQNALIGSTETVTPSEVLSAMQEGRPVVIAHTDETYGLVATTSFLYSGLADVVASSGTFLFNGAVVSFELGGYLENNTWFFAVHQMATTEDIPTNTSDLTNDSGFITLDAVEDLRQKTVDGLWNGDLYDSGNEYEIATGGWTTFAYAGSPYLTAAAPTVTREETYIDVSQTALRGGAMVTTEPVDITGFDKLIFDLSNITLSGTGTVITLSVADSLNSDLVTLASKTISTSATDRATHEIDVSNLTGNVHISIHLGTAQNGSASCRVHSIKLFRNTDQASNTVQFVPQELTDEQKAQARTNINAVSREEVEELLGIEEEFSVSGELIELDLDIEPGTELNVVSKIQRDSTWSESNKLVLHQVSGDNFVDLSSYLGGAGTIFETNGLTATINTDGTLSITGTNTSAGWTEIVSINDWNGEHGKRIYPSGTYKIPSGLTIQIRAAQYPADVKINGLTGNLQNTFTTTEPFRIVRVYYAVASGTSVDKTIPLGLFHSESIPESGYEYVGNLYTVTFDDNAYEGEYNWSTGELKDADGNTIGYYGPQTITRLSGINYFWTGFGENTISNKTNGSLEKVVITLGESAPVETVPSICEFTLKPATKNYSINVYGDNRKYFSENGVFHKKEVPLITTRGKIVAHDLNGEVAYTADVPELIGYKGLFDVMTGNEITKCWSDRFYITREPDSIEYIDDGSGQAATNPNAIATWTFSKDDFEELGLPVKATNLQIVSPYFIGTTEETLVSKKLNYSAAYHAFFSYDSVNDNYIFKCRARNFYGNALYKWTSAYFCYPLEEEVICMDSMLSMYVDKGYTISFEQDDAFDPFLEYSFTQDWCPFIDETGTALWNPNTKPTDEEIVKSLVDVTPNVGIFVPRSVADALYEAEHIAKRLNNREVQDNNLELNSYQWIGEGDGATDYTEKIQKKLDEIHYTSNGGTIYLGPGTYPISNSLIVYGNTRIIGDGQTVIEQTADNTHAVIWNGSSIVMRDLTIKLSGACTELTACVFVNSNNVASGNRDERYPENTYVWNCSVNNVTLIGEYSLTYEEGNQYLSDAALAYRGVGIMSMYLFFNFFDCDGLFCDHLYAGVYTGGGSNNYRLSVTHSRMAVYSNGGNNRYEIKGHTYYGYNSENVVGATDYIVYSEGECNIYDISGFYDDQYTKACIYFAPRSMRNICYLKSQMTEQTNVPVPDVWGKHVNFINYGRCNEIITPTRETYFAIGNRQFDITGQRNPQKNLSPSVDNALAGAGVWGNISSNVQWTENGITLADACRYPKDGQYSSTQLASIVSSVSPSNESPVEIVLDISNRPIYSYYGLWIQFDHRYVAQDMTFSFDTNNDGTYDFTWDISNNVEPVVYWLGLQRGTVPIYRIKISVTKALVIPELSYQSADYTPYTIDYNPDGLIGIVNIGMPQNDAYGRAFLGECGGSLYGNVDMHQNTLKNLPNPVDNGDVANKAYVDALAQCITDIEIDQLLALIQ